MSKQVNDEELYFGCEELSEKELNEILPYVCPFCGNRFSDPDSFLKCATECRKEQMAKDAKDRAEKLRKEQSSRINKINIMASNLETELNTYEKDYGKQHTFVGLEIFDILNITRAL